MGQVRDQVREERDMRGNGYISPLMTELFCPRLEISPPSTDHSHQASPLVRKHLCPHRELITESKEAVSGFVSG